jgi:hypothetical protein
VNGYSNLGMLPITGMAAASASLQSKKRELSADLRETTTDRVEVGLIARRPAEVQQRV